MKFNVLIQTSRWKGVVPVEADSEEGLPGKAAEMARMIEEDHEGMDEAMGVI